MTKYTLPSAVVPGVGDVDDVRVADLRCRARLAAEPLDEIRHARVARVQDLERDALADLDVLGEVDLAHAALADQLDHAVAAVDLGADEIGLGSSGSPRASACARRAAAASTPLDGARRRGDRRRCAAIDRRRSPRSLGAPADRARLAHRRVVVGRRRRRRGDLDALADCSIIWRSSSVGGSVSARVRTRAISSARSARSRDDVLGEQLVQERRHPRAVGGRRVAARASVCSAIRISSQSRVAIVLARLRAP